MERNKKIIKTSILGIIINLILVFFKAIVGFLANSIAIVLDAVNNLSDALSAIITIIGMKLSAKKPDKEHPYGHGRIEYFASVIISVLILIAGVGALKESVIKIINPEVANYSAISLIIISIAIIVKVFFGSHVKSVGIKINSHSLIATGTDALMDAILSLSTLIGAVISLVWNLSVEGYLGVLISFIILKSGFGILKETITIMIGQRADPKLTNKIKEKILSYNEVQGVYDLALHNYGPLNTIGSLHIQVRDDMTAKEIHSLTREISYMIYKEFGIIMSIGIYAANDSGEFLEIKEELNKIISSYKDILQMHGFYGDEEKKTISFDLIIDFNVHNSEEIKEKIINELKEKYPEYKYNVVIDMDISD